MPPTTYFINIIFIKFIIYQKNWYIQNGLKPVLLEIGLSAIKTNRVIFITTCKSNDDATNWETLFKPSQIPLPADCIGNTTSHGHSL